MQSLRVFGLLVCAAILASVSPAEQAHTQLDRVEMQHVVLQATVSSQNEKLADLRNRLDKTDQRIEASEVRLLAMQSSLDRMTGFVTGGITLVGVLQALQLIIGRKKGG